MPRKVTAWACSFGCGTTPTASHVAMVMHESGQCLRNPANLGCETCVHDDVHCKTGNRPATYPKRCFCRYHELRAEFKDVTNAQT